MSTRIDTIQRLLVVGTHMIESEGDCAPQVVMHTEAEGYENIPFLQALRAATVEDTFELALSFGMLTAVANLIRPLTEVSVLTAARGVIAPVPDDLKDGPIEGHIERIEAMINEMPPVEENPHAFNALVIHSLKKDQRPVVQVFPYTLDDHGKVEWQPVMDMSEEGAEEYWSSDPISVMCGRALNDREKVLGLLALSEQMAISATGIRPETTGKGRLTPHDAAVFLTRIADQHGLKVAINRSIVGYDEVEEGDEA